MVPNTGNDVDAPFHFHESAADTAGLPLKRLVDAPARQLATGPVGPLTPRHYQSDKPCAAATSQGG